jgi:hypothetical protein
MLEPSTPHIGKGVALVAQVAPPVYSRVYSISDSRNDHSSFYETHGLYPACELTKLRTGCHFSSDSKECFAGERGGGLG